MADLGRVGHGQAKARTKAESQIDKGQSSEEEVSKTSRVGAG